MRERFVGWAVFRRLRRTSSRELVNGVVLGSYHPWGPPDVRASPSEEQVVVRHEMTMDELVG